MRKYALSLSAALSALMLFAASPAEAKIKRHCEAAYKYYFFQVTDLRGKPVRFAGTPFALMKGVRGKYLRASGTCGLTVPNRCRRRAAKRLRDCGAAHHVRPGIRPAQCRGVRNVPGNLRGAITRSVCDALKTKILSKADRRYRPPFRVRVKAELLLRGRKSCSVNGSRGVPFQKIIVRCR